MLKKRALRGSYPPPPPLAMFQWYQSSTPPKYIVGVVVLMLLLRLDDLIATIACIVVCALMGMYFVVLFLRSLVAKLTIKETEARQKSEQAKREAEATRALAEQAKRYEELQTDQGKHVVQATEKLRWTDLHHEEVVGAEFTEAAVHSAREDATRFRQEAIEERARAQKVEEEAKRMREEMEEIVRRAEELASAATHSAREDVTKFERLAQEERERAKKVQEDAEREITTTKEDAARVRQAADELNRYAEAVMASAEEKAGVAAEEVRKAKETKREVDEFSKKIMIPSPKHVAASKRNIRYSENHFHFAVIGASGSGKSSLVNAFRGLRPQDVGAALEGTQHTARYPDPNPDKPFVWYDIPSERALQSLDFSWQYFNNQGLYAFDCIIVLIDKRFTITDIAILSNARRFDIPTYIVRSKADQHIQNMMGCVGYDSDDENEGRRNVMYVVAHARYIEETRKFVQKSLQSANLADQRVYIVSNNSLLKVIQSKTSTKAIDEMELVNDLVNEARTKRKIGSP